MELLLITLATYPISYIIKLITVANISKDAANNGYLIDIDAYKEYNKVEDKESKINKLKYIPYANIIDSLSTNIEYLLDRQNVFEQMRIGGVFLSMTKEEEDSYNANPTFLRAMNLSTKRMNKVNEDTKESLKSNIVYYDKKLDEHNYIVKDKEEYYKVKDFEEYIDTLSKDELEELRNSLIAINRFDDVFKADNDSDLTISSKNDKRLILRYNCKDNDKKTK